MREERLGKLERAAGVDEYAGERALDFVMTSTHFCSVNYKPCELLRLQLREAKTVVSGGESYKSGTPFHVLVVASEVHHGRVVLLDAVHHTLHRRGP
jgi:hypothetical protein